MIADDTATRDVTIAAASQGKAEPTHEVAVTAANQPNSYRDRACALPKYLTTLNTTSTASANHGDD